jgi:hypothetical protein
MRNLTRSVASFSWAMSLFGVEQMANLVSPRRAAAAFGTVVRSAEGTLGPGLRSAFQTGDRLQRSMVDLSFSLVGLGPSATGGGAAPTTASGSGSTGAAAAISGPLTQVGNLAFELLQLGVTTVYWAAGTAWSQQQGLPGWGNVDQQAPGTSSQQ